jgi:formamidopyrimidine-DNA glycosylase
VGHRLLSVGRRAKYLVFTFDDDNRIVVHLSQAGRLDIEDPPKKTKPRGSVARFTFTAPTGEDESHSPRSVALLVREHGTQRKASWWVLTPGADGPLADLGPEPGSKQFAEFIRTSDSNRHLTTDLRDQHTVSGIGRGWGDDILQRAKLSPFASLRSLTEEQREALIKAAVDVMHEALELERTREGGLSEAKLGGRFKIHNRFGQPCPTCGDTLERVSFESYEMSYCPTCQTGGKVLADRRLSRLLK